MTFEEAVAIILDIEGGYVHNPNDPGGETNYGIAKKYHPGVDIKNLTRFEAMQIYRAEYWNPLNLDEFPDELRLILFDCAVNQGVYKARGFACEAMGVVSYMKLNQNLFNLFTPDDIQKSVKRIAQLRMDAYMSSKHWNEFGKGWVARLLHVTAKSSVT